MVTQEGITSDYLESWAVIILNWNTAAKTINCGHSVDAAAALCPALRISIIIVDNDSGSSDQTTLRAAIAVHADWRVEWVAENLGFAGGMNAGLQVPEAKSCERVLFLNSDISLKEDFFTHLMAHIKKNPTEALTGMQIRRATDESVEVLGGYQYFDWFGVSKRVTVEHERIDYPAGSAFLCDLAFLEKINGIPTQNFLYFEELNLTKHLNHRQTLGVSSRSIAWHEGGASTALLKGSTSMHYYAAIACFRYTLTTNKLRLPSVILVRLSYLLLRSILERNSIAVCGGINALSDFFKEVMRR